MGGRSLVVTLFARSPADTRIGIDISAFVTRNLCEWPGIGVRNRSPPPSRTRTRIEAGSGLASMTLTERTVSPNSLETLVSRTGGRVSTTTRRTLAVGSLRLLGD